jgi:hypothetical protein
MNCGDGPAFRIGEQDRRAIRALDRQEYARNVSEKRVSFGGLDDCRGRRGDPVHDIRMNLLDCDEAHSIGANRMKELLAVR